MRNAMNILAGSVFVLFMPFILIYLAMSGDHAPRKDVCLASGGVGVYLEGTEYCLKKDLFVEPKK